MLDRLIALERKALSTATGIARLGVVEDEAATVEATLMVESHAPQIDGGLPIQEDPEVIKLDHRVPVALLGELKQIAEPRAASPLDTQSQTGLILLGHESPHLFASGLGEFNDRFRSFGLNLGLFPAEFPVKGDRGQI